MANIFPKHSPTDTTRRSKNLGTTKIVSLIGFTVVFGQFDFAGKCIAKCIDSPQKNKRIGEHLANRLGLIRYVGQSLIEVFQGKLELWDTECIASR